MSTGSTQTPASGPDLRPFYVMAAVAVGAIVVGVVMMLVILDRKLVTPPAPASDTIPADVKAHLYGGVAALRSVAVDVQAGKVKADADSVAKALTAARKTTTDKLSADVQAGDVAANLRRVADEESKLIRGAPSK